MTDRLVEGQEFQIKIKTDDLSFEKRGEVGRKYVKDLMTERSSSFFFYTCTLLSVLSIIFAFQNFLNFLFFLCFSFFALFYLNKYSVQKFKNQVKFNKKMIIVES